MNSIFFVLFLCVTFQVNAQNSIEDLLKQYNTHEIPYISVHELAMPKIQAIILDARELEEYNISHIENAVLVGYKNFNLEQTTKHLTDKKKTIVVYCSLGIRSENIAKKLKKDGYTNVYNLYGGIFEWKNKDFKVMDSEGHETENIHAFSETWSKWLLKGQKVYQ